MSDEKPEKEEIYEASVSFVRNPLAALKYLGGKLISGLTGSVIDEKVEAAKRDGREQGSREAKAEYANIFDKAKAQADERKRHAREQNRYDDLTMTLFAVGIAVLAQCRAITADNVAGIKEFAFGSAHSSLPAAVLAEIARIEAAPPNLATALARARKVAADDLDLIDQMVLVASDCVGPAKGHELISVWAQLRAA
jgi:hypothetical protein